MATKIEKVTPVLDLIEKAGGIKMPLLKELSPKERIKVAYSVWAFLFSIFYYVYHGMWKKGLVLLAVSVAVTIPINLFLPTFANITWIITSVIYATRAPVNLYSKYRLNDDSWNPFK